MKNSAALVDSFFSGSTAVIQVEEKVRIFDVLFGCLHKRTTFPISKRGTRKTQAAGRTGTYLVCLECGKEFAYDWQKMRIMTAREEKTYARAQVEAQAS
ncbi:MAG TPA: hypothetical protein VKW06_14965 [Candidatus Angelobacter sp.]|nr:hypothetical protein [Candidatus Angelobacter sp.]